MNRVNEPVVALLPHLFLPLGLCPQLDCNSEVIFDLALSLL